MKKRFKEYLPDSWFYFPIIGLALCLILKMIHIGTSFSRYPFNSITDLNRRMLQLFFLGEYGFHQAINDAYHHIILFEDYPPGWFYFTLPFYRITQDLLVAIFLSLLAILILGFLFVYFLNKNLPPIQKIAFFLFFFANLQMIDYLQIGRYPEMLGWVIFIPLFYYIVLYKKRKIDLQFFLIISFLFSSLILIHIYVAVLSSIIIISLFFVKNYKEKLIIFLTVLTSLIVTSFWWVPFLKFIKNSYLIINSWTEELLHQGSFISYNTIFILGLFLIAFFYVKQIKDKKNNKDILFLTPSLILSFFVITRVILFIPVLNRVPVTPYNTYFLFLAVYIFFHVDFNKIRKAKIIIPLGLILLTLSSLFIFYLRITPFVYPKDKLREEIISIFPLIEENFFIFNTENSMVRLTNEAKMYYNLSSPAKVIVYPVDEESKLNDAFKNQDCDRLNRLVQELYLKNLISYNHGCNVLKTCGFKERIHKEKACLYSSGI